MPRHDDQRLLAYTPQQMFDLVADVPRYPQFLPWVIGARVTARRPGGMTADLIVGFKMFRETFTSNVTLDAPAEDEIGHIHVDYVKGPLKYLHNDWRFHPTDDGGTLIDFYVDFEFKNALFERLVGGLFSEAVMRMVSAFEARAHVLYGETQSSPGRSKPSATRTA